MKILIGDILKSKAQTLINTVNCVGIMGKGIALEFKKCFPAMFADYIARCRRNEVKPGLPYLYRELTPPQIVNFPTKDHWKSVAKISDIERGLKYLLDRYKEWGITSLAVPPLGCGNGRLEWSVVGPLIYKYANRMDIPVEMYAPYGTPSKALTVEFLAHAEPGGIDRVQRASRSSLNPAWVALVEILHRIEEQPYHWPVGRVIFQKIAYVATQQGLPTGFRYARGSFGPFCKELKYAETELVNSNLLQEHRRGNMFVMQVGPNFTRIRKHFESLLSRWTTIIEKTTDLFMRLNTEQAEIVATVIYAANSLRERSTINPTESQLLQSVMQWKQKRHPLPDESMVGSVIRNLAMLHWLRVIPDPNLPVEDDERISA